MHNNNISTKIRGYLVFDLESGRLAGICFGLLVVGISLIAINFLGTPDVGDFLLWSARLTQDGVFRGYGAIADYPPLGPLFIWVATSLGRWCHVQSFVALKLSIDCFQLISALLIWRRYRSWSAASLFFLFLSPFGGLLGYIDVFYLPFVLVGIFALERDRLAIATLSLTIATLIKWQPAILGPVLGVYTVSRVSTLPTLMKRVAWPLPAALFSLVIIFAFGPRAVWIAFSGATDDTYFSGQAFNLDWILTYLFEFFQIANEHFAGGNSIELIKSLPLPWYMLSRYLFWVVFFCNIVIFAYQKKTFDTLLLCLVTAASIQFTFNTGVHENHGFLIMVLAFIACYDGILPSLYLTYSAFLAIANIVAFYGITIGVGSAFSIGTVILSALQLLICTTLIGRLAIACYHNGCLSRLIRCGESIESDSELKRNEPRA
jgi:hypothetical protein